MSPNLGANLGANLGPNPGPNLDPAFDERYRASFRIVESLEPPRPTRGFVWVLVLTAAVLAAVATITPWLQTALGYGQLIALNPIDRVQPVTALVSGRIGKWHVQDGSRVKQGDPLVEIVDNDPNFVERLETERLAMQSQYDAARIATETALLDVNRRQRLFDKGLAARREVETAQIRYRELKSTEAQASASLAKAQTALSRRSTQIVYAPRDGMVMKIIGGDTSTFVSAGSVLASLAPDGGQRAVEIFVNGLDATLVQPGQRVRLMFEGWPAVQFSGWPSVAVGTFPGVVQFVDPAVSLNGRYRVVVIEDQTTPWPDERFLRLGGRARGWVLLNEVRLGYEIWRQLNSFPPEPTTAVTGAEGAAMTGAASDGDAGGSAP